jgi:hypothetical protein
MFYILLFSEIWLLSQEGRHRLLCREADHQALQDPRAPLSGGRQGLDVAHRLPKENGEDGFYLSRPHF